MECWRRGVMAGYKKRKALRPSSRRWDAEGPLTSAGPGSGWRGLEEPGRRRSRSGGGLWSFGSLWSGSSRCGRSFRGVCFGGIGLLLVGFRSGGGSRSRRGGSGRSRCHGNRARSGRGGRSRWRRGRLVTEELRLLRSLFAGGEHGEGQRENEKQDGEIDGELLEDVRGLRTPDLAGHGIAERGTEALLARTLHEDNENEEQADEDFDHR